MIVMSKAAPHPSWRNDEVKDIRTECTDPLVEDGCVKLTTELMLKCFG